MTTLASCCQIGKWLNSQRTQGRIIRQMPSSCNLINISICYGAKKLLLCIKVPRHLNSYYANVLIKLSEPMARVKMLFFTFFYFGYLFFFKFPLSKVFPTTAVLKHSTVVQALESDRLQRPGWLQAPQHSVTHVVIWVIAATHINGSWKMIYCQCHWSEAQP